MSEPTSLSGSAESPEPHSPGAACTCVHMWIEGGVMKPVPRWCLHCTKLVMVYESKKKCALCDAYYHEACFKELSAKRVADNIDTLSQRHVHTLVDKMLPLPTRCGVCQHLIMPQLGLTSTVPHAMTCQECPMTIHKTCLVSVPADDFRTKEFGEIVAEGKARSAAVKSNTDDVIGSVKMLLEHFDQRHSGWKSQLLNPVTMLKLQSKHDAEYHALVDAAADAAISVAQLEAVRNALRYATAVYGASYHEGYFQSAVNTMAMRAIRPDLLTTKPEVNDAAVMDTLMLPRANLVYSHWGRDVFDGSYCILVDPEQSLVVLAFRGSLSDEDFLTDVAGLLEPFAADHPDGPRVHQGINAMVLAIMRNETFQAKLTAALDQYPAYGFVATGHSLGGGLTQLFSAHLLLCPAEPLHRFASRFRSYAFAPPPTMTSELADATDAQCVAVVAAKDCVSRLQIPSVCRLGAELAKVATQPSDDDHGVLDAPECHLTGRVLLTTSATNSAAKIRIVQLDRRHELLHRIWISTQHMVNNHAMNNYAEALWKIRDKLSSTTVVA